MKKRDLYFTAKTTKTTATVLAVGAILAGAVFVSTANAATRKARVSRGQEQVAYGDGDALRQEVAQNQEKYRDLVQKLEQAVGEAQQTLTALQGEKARLLSQVEAARNEVVSLRLKNDQRQQELQDKRAQAAGLQQALESQERLMGELEAKLEALVGKVPGHEEAIRQEQALRRKDQEIESLRGQVAALTREKEQLAHETTATIGELKAELQNRNTSHAELESAAQDLITKFNTIEAALKREQTARKEAQQRNVELAQQLSGAGADLKRSEEQLAAARTSEEQLRQALRGTEVALAEVSARLEAQQKTAQQIAKEHEATTARSSKLADSLSQATTKRDETDRRLKEREAEVKQLKAALVQAEKDKQSAVADAKSSIEMLEGLLDKHQELLGALERVRSNISQPGRS
ncbi:MAG: hypothetical protein JXB04_07145 [Kiritimatiellae bacterium]|nr:hypothetical protein [Kiritimatiellia bacterium]